MRRSGYVNRITRLFLILKKIDKNVRTFGKYIIFSYCDDKLQLQL